MPNVTKGAEGQGYKRARRGDVRTLVRIDSPDDAEIAEPLGETGDGSSLVKIDSPDDAQLYDADNPTGGKPDAAVEGKDPSPAKKR